ncbi:MAG: hypothetical protein JWP81_4457 [Ferruginibacter sp.]|nr:hypothetical protein [Ferruginibacter sp.]
MEQQELSSNPYLRRQVIVFSIMTFVCLISLRFLILPHYVYHTAIPETESIINQVLEGFIVALVSGVSITFFLLWLFPGAKEQAQIKVLTPGSELKKFLADDLGETIDFGYRGHTAKWTRSVTLQTLSKKAQAKGATCKLTIVILDPNNYAACKLLADLDHKRNKSLDAPSRVKFIQKQLFATILCILDKVDEPYLDIQLGLHNNFSLFRIDLTSESAIITRANPKEVAIRFSAQSDFYRSYQEELRISFSQSKKIPIKEVSAFHLSELNVAGCKAAFNLIGIETGIMTDAELGEVIEIAKEAKNPYED